jgi:hypothetical protein
MGYYMGLSGHFRAPVALVPKEAASYLTVDSKLSRFQRQSRRGEEKKTLFPCLQSNLPPPESSAHFLVTILTELPGRNY